MGLKSSVESSTLNGPSALTAAALPVVDLSALFADDDDLRTTALHDLTAACRDWGIFMLVNHEIPETLMNTTFAVSKEYFDLPESEKKKYEAQCVTDPIKSGKIKMENGSSQIFWRENLKFYAHNLHFPPQPQLLRETVLEFTERTRKVNANIIAAMCDALELDRRYVDEILKFDSSFQFLLINYYPPCPHPEQAIGLPPHVDPGLLTLLIHNGVAGLEIEHEGQWYKVDSPRNSVLMIIGDQVEIFTNGRFKGPKHRAVLNKEKERISVLMGNGPSGEAVVCPAPPLVEKDGHTVPYCPMKYHEYLNRHIHSEVHDEK